MSNRFKSRYDDDINLFEGRWHMAQYAILAALLLAAPWVLGNYYLGELTAVLVWSLAQINFIPVIGDWATQVLDVIQPNLDVDVEVQDKPDQP